MQNSSRIKEEELPDDAALSGSYIPDGFDPYEWNALINVIITAFYHFLC